MISKNVGLRNACVILLLLVGAAPAMASSRCKVTDPTGTPLNIRDIHKNIIGTITNGHIVIVLRDGFDDAGKPWAYVANAGGQPLGWVYREFISCY